MENQKNIFILGMGNEVLMDDSVGPKVVWELQKCFDDPRISFDTAAVGGLEILEQIKEYKHVIIIDAIKTLDGVVGSVYYMTPDNFKETSHISNLHDVSFLTALKLGKQLGISIPEKIDIIAIEILEDMTFGNDFTPELQAQYPQALAKVKEMVTELISPKPQAPNSKSQE